MAASRNDVDRWISIARENKSEFIISICDTWDYEDYPVYCDDIEELRKRYTEYAAKDMQKINEVIRVPRKKPAIENLSMDELW